MCCRCSNQQSAMQDLVAGQALSLKRAILMEALTHPGWIVEYLRRGGGTPMLQNWQPYGVHRRGCRRLFSVGRPLIWRTFGLPGPCAFQPEACVLHPGPKLGVVNYSQGPFPNSQGLLAPGQSLFEATCL